MSFALISGHTHSFGVLGLNLSFKQLEVRVFNLSDRVGGVLSEHRSSVRSQFIRHASGSERLFPGEDMNAPQVINI